MIRLDESYLSDPHKPETQEYFGGERAPQIAKDLVNERLQDIAQEMISRRGFNAQTGFEWASDDGWLANVVEIARTKDRYINQTLQQIGQIAGADQNGNNILGERLGQEIGHYSDVDQELVTGVERNGQSALDHAISSLLRRGEQAQNTSLTAIEYLEMVGGAYIENRADLVRRHVKTREDKQEALTGWEKFNPANPVINWWTGQHHRRFLIAPGTALSAKAEDIEQGLSLAREKFQSSIDSMKGNKNIELTHIRNRISEQYRLSINAATQIEDPLGATATATEITDFLHAVSLNPRQFLNGTLVCPNGGNVFLAADRWTRTFGTDSKLDLIDALKHHSFDKVAQKHPGTSYLEGAVAEKESETLSDSNRESFRRHEDRYNHFHDVLEDPSNTYFSELAQELELGAHPVDPHRRKVKLTGSRGLIADFETNLQRSTWSLNDIYDQIPTRINLSPEEKVWCIAKFLVQNPNGVDVIPPETQSKILRWMRDTHGTGGEKFSDATIEDGGEASGRIFYERCMDAYTNAGFVLEFMNNPNFQTEAFDENSPVMGNFYGVVDQMIYDYDTYYKGKDHPWSFENAKKKLKPEEVNRLADHWRIVEPIVRQMREAGTNTKGEPSKPFLEKLRSIPERLKKQKQRDDLRAAIMDPANIASSTLNKGPFDAMKEQLDSIQKELDDDGEDINKNNFRVPRVSVPSHVGTLPTWPPGGGGLGSGLGFNTAHLVAEIARRDPAAFVEQSIDDIMRKELLQPFVKQIHKTHHKERNRHLVTSLANLEKLPVGSVVNMEYQVVPPGAKDSRGPGLHNIETAVCKNFTIIHTEGGRFVLKGRMKLRPADQKKRIRALETNIEQKQALIAKQQEKIDSLRAQVQQIDNDLNDAFQRYPHGSVPMSFDQYQQEKKNLTASRVGVVDQIEGITAGFSQLDGSIVALRQKISTLEEGGEEESDVVVLLNRSHLPGHPSGGHAGKMAILNAEHYDDRIVDGALDTRRFRAYADKASHHGLLRDYICGANADLPYQETDAWDRSQKEKIKNDLEAKRKKREEQKQKAEAKASKLTQAQEQLQAFAQSKKQSPATEEASPEAEAEEAAPEALNPHHVFDKLATRKLSPEEAAELKNYFEDPDHGVERRQKLLDQIAHILREEKEGIVLIAGMAALYQAVFGLDIDDFFGPTTYESNQFIALLLGIKTESEEAKALAQTLVVLLGDPSPANRAPFEALLAPFLQGEEPSTEAAAAEEAEAIAEGEEVTEPVETTLVDPSTPADDSPIEASSGEGGGEEAPDALMGGGESQVEKLRNEQLDRIEAILREGAMGSRIEVKGDMIVGNTIHGSAGVILGRRGENKTTIESANKNPEPKTQVEADVETVHEAEQAPTEETAPQPTRSSSTQKTVNEDRTINRTEVVTINETDFGDFTKQLAIIRSREGLGGLSAYLNVKDIETRNPRRKAFIDNMLAYMCDSTTEDQGFEAFEVCLQHQVLKKGSLTGSGKTPESFVLEIYKKAGKDRALTTLLQLRRSGLMTEKQRDKVLDKIED